MLTEVDEDEDEEGEEKPLTKFEVYRYMKLYIFQMSIAAFQINLFAREYINELAFFK